MIPNVTVVIPAYNRQKTIERSLDSVLGQSYGAIEVIVIDDCSCDETVDIVKRNYISDERVRLIELKENHGAAYCRNLGVELSSCPIIAFQDSDDEWRTDRLEIQLKAMNSSQADIVIGRIDRHGYGSDDGILPDRHIAGGFVDFEIVLRGGLVATPSILIRKSLMLDFKFDTKLKWCEDYEWSIRIAEKTPFYLVDDVVVDVFLQENSVTIVNADKKLPFYKKMLMHHQSVLEAFPWFYAEVLSGYAKQIALKGGDGSPYFLFAFRKAHRLKDLIKWALSKLGVAEYVFKFGQK